MKMVQKIKEIINSGRPVDINKIKLQIEKYDVVSFDIFDTLLKRNVKKPTDVFEYIEKKHNIENFSEKRIKSEKQARSLSEKKEISLKDIYDQYGFDYSTEELQTESELLIANIDILPLFKYCVEKKRVILTSDMYLPEEFIKDILNREGFSGYEKMYISSSLDKTKKDGDLFDYVLSDLKINKNKIIHIGDSLFSDYKNPTKKQISAIHIPTYIKKAKYQLAGDNIEENIINNFINNTINKKCDDYYRFGYEKYGMFLWGYIKWIHKNLIDEGIDKVYFFSRDGYIMKQAFDLLYSDVQTYYLEVSRRALRIPILWMNYDFKHVLDMISPSKLIPLSTIFDGVGLDISNYEELIQEYGFNVNTTFDRETIASNDNLLEMYKKLEKDIVDKSNEEYKCLVEYIKQNKLKGKFAIVDIGWSGGMQRYLCETLDYLKIEHEVKGYYCGVADYCKRNIIVMPSLDLNGYLFDFLHNENAKDCRSSFVGLFETLFLEQAGTVVNYKLDNKIVKANRKEYEYIIDGKPTFELESVRKMQQGALDFVSKFGNKDINLTADVLFKGIEETGTNPKKHDLDLFANFRFFDEGNTQYLAKPKIILRYLIDLKMFKEDFLMCRWKIGFMKKMLKVQLPYKKIYDYLKNKSKRR